MNRDEGISIFDFPVFAANFGEGIVFASPSIAIKFDDIAADLSDEKLSRESWVNHRIPTLRQVGSIREERANEQAENDAALLGLLEFWGEAVQPSAIPIDERNALLEQRRQSKPTDDSDSVFGNPTELDDLLRLNPS